MQVLFFICGALALGAGLAAVVQRHARRAMWLMTLSGLGVAGVLLILQAPLVAALQILLCAAGVALLFTDVPRPLRGLARSDAWGTRRVWWAAVLVAAALCGVLVWAALSAIPITGQAAPAALVDWVVPLALALVVLLLAIAGAAEIVRGR